MMWKQKKAGYVVFHDITTKFLWYGRQKNHDAKPQAVGVRLSESKYQLGSQKVERVHQSVTF
jgi:hypothetical protein